MVLGGLKIPRIVPFTGSTHGFGTHMAFDNSYARLPERFFARLAPTPVPAPRLIRLNDDLARHLGIDPDRLAAPDGVEMLAGNRLPEGAEPLAMAYAGHQFGNWVPQLGDGRAVLLGEVRDRDGVRRDIQLKGAGRLRSRAWATAAPRSAPFCASTSSARRWPPSAFGPPARLPW
jgi:hypothetical protein